MAFKCNLTLEHCFRGDTCSAYHVTNPRTNLWEVTEFYFSSLSNWHAVYNRKVQLLISHYVMHFAQNF